MILKSDWSDFSQNSIKDDAKSHMGNFREDFARETAPENSVRIKNCIKILLNIKLPTLWKLLSNVEGHEIIFPKL